MEFMLNSLLLPHNTVHIAVWLWLNERYFHLRTWLNGRAAGLEPAYYRFESGRPHLIEKKLQIPIDK